MKKTLFVTLVFLFALNLSGQQPVKKEISDLAELIADYQLTVYSSDTDKQLHEKAIQDAAKKLTNEEYKLAVKMVPKIVDDKREKMNADWKKLNDAIEKSIKEQSKSWSSTKKADKSPSVKDYTTDEPEKYLPNKD